MAFKQRYYKCSTHEKELQNKLFMFILPNHETQVVLLESFKETQETVERNRDV